MYNNELIIPCEGLFSSFKMFPLVDLAGQQRPALRGWAATALGRQGGKDGGDEEEDGDEEGNLPCVFELLRCKGRFYCDLHKKEKNRENCWKTMSKFLPTFQQCRWDAAKTKWFSTTKLFPLIPFYYLPPPFKMWAILQKIKIFSYTMCSKESSVSF